MGFDAWRGILFDLDGVLYNSTQLIEGAVGAVEWVQAQRIPYLYVTNTTSRSRELLAQKLAAFGFRANAEEILTPVLAAAQWLRAQNKIGKLALFVPVATQPEFAGLPCLADNAETGADYVVVGDLGQGWDYATLNRAFRLLHHNPDAVLVALGMTRYWQTERGVALDVGPFVAALENAAGRKAMVFGKPAASFFQAAAERLGLPAEQLLMIGDDIITDIGGAQSAGLQGALVKTGKFRTSDLAGSVRPDVVLDSIANLPQVWKPATS